MVNNNDGKCQLIVIWPTSTCFSDWSRCSQCGQTCIVAKHN